VPLEREHGVVAHHARAVIADANRLPPAVLDRDVDRLGAGVQRVLDQLFHDRRRAFDDLARGDLIGDVARQDGDARWRSDGHGAKATGASRGRSIADL
jgi:hypothetical protein